MIKLTPENSRNMGRTPLFGTKDPSDAEKSIPLPTNDPSDHDHRQEISKPAPITITEGTDPYENTENDVARFMDDGGNPYCMPSPHRQRSLVERFKYFFRPYRHEHPDPMEPLMPNDSTAAPLQSGMPVPSQINE